MADRGRVLPEWLWNDLIVLVLNSSPSFSAMAKSRRATDLTLSRLLRGLKRGRGGACRDGDSSGPTGWRNDPDFASPRAIPNRGVEASTFW